MDSAASDHQSVMTTVKHHRHERDGAIPARLIVGECIGHYAPGRHRKPDPSPVVRVMQEATS